MSGEEARALRRCPLEAQTINEKDRVSRNPGTGGLANLNSDLTAFLGEGRNKRGWSLRSGGRPTASQWDTPTLALRRDAANRGSLLSRAGASGDDLTGGSHHV